MVNYKLIIDLGGTDSNALFLQPSQGLTLFCSLDKGKLMPYTTLTKSVIQDTVGHLKYAISYKE